MSFSASQVAPEEEEHKLNWGRYKQYILHLKRRPESPNTLLRRDELENKFFMVWDFMRVAHVLHNDLMVWNERENSLTD